MITIEEIREDFEFLDHWEDRLKYIVELGRELPPMADEDKVDENRMYGCQSRVWITCARSESVPPLLHFMGASDAQIVRGLITIVFAMVNDQTAEYIVSCNIRDVFEELNLIKYLTPSRANGLNQLVDTIKQSAGEILVI